jgi:hypothetical protein
LMAIGAQSRDDPEGGFELGSGGEHDLLRE